jgi:hypothetical protein
MPAWDFKTLPQDIKAEFLDLKVITGETDIDDSVQTETTPWTILTILAGVYDLHDVEVWLDLAKATTGFATVESTATIAFAVARAVDGTNYRREAIQEAALSGTLAALRMAKITVGRIPAGQAARIMATMSADATSDMELPYQVIYRGLAAPTVTPVVAG